MKFNNLSELVCNYPVTEVAICIEFQRVSLQCQADGLPVFKVQILASSVRPKTGDKKLKGQSDVDFYEEGGLVKYTCGASTDYNEIYRLRKQLVGKFPEAFIIAFRNGTKTDVRAAIQEFRERRNKK